MGKPAGKKKKRVGAKTNEMKSGEPSLEQRKSGESITRVFDKDTTIFIDMSHELKSEGNGLFQKRDYEGAILRYEKAVKLLPKNHSDVAYLRSNLAACYMQMGGGDYHKAINECNLALEVSPLYSKALLKRARCYEALHRLDSALKDVDMVLGLDPNNLTALEISERVRKGLRMKGNKPEDKAVVSFQESAVAKEKEKMRKKKSRKPSEEKVDAKGEKEDAMEEKADAKEVKADVKEENDNYDMKNHKPAVENSSNVEEEAMKVIKLVFGEDIRWALLPSNCSILQLREIIRNRFPRTKAFLIKYKDIEADLVTITTTQELRWAEESADPLGSFRLYIMEVGPEQDPLFVEDAKRGLEAQNPEIRSSVSINGNSVHEVEGGSYIDDWIVQFARLFKNHVGFNSDACLDLHEHGMKLYSEGMEDTLTIEESQDLLDVAAQKFQDMAALAMFNWGNVHMSRARKRLILPEDASPESVLAQAKIAYDWARKEYRKAGERYEEALKIKPDFYEGLLALALQQFEQAKLSWYFAIGSKVDLETGPSSEVIELFNSAEDNIERGTWMFEDLEEKRLNEIHKPDLEKIALPKMGLDGSFELSTDEAAERSSSIRSQINCLWGTMLYERSVVEFKLGYAIWDDSLAAAVEKFKLAGASPTDIAVMIKNHCSDETAQEGLGFKIEEIVQAWNEMHDAKRWLNDVSSFHLGPLFRRRAPGLHRTLEHF